MAVVKSNRFNKYLNTLQGAYGVARNLHGIYKTYKDVGTSMSGVARWFQGNKNKLPKPSYNKQKFKRRRVDEEADTEKGGGSRSKVTSTYKMRKSSRRPPGGPKRRKRHTRRHKYTGPKKYIKGPTSRVDYWQLYFTNKDGTLVTNGQFGSNVNECGYAFIPLFEDRQMNAEFRVGESTALTGTVGFFDPPPVQTYAAGVKTTYGVNLIKSTEVFSIDYYNVKLYISNTGDTKVHLEIDEWICNEDCGIAVADRALQLFNTQQTQNSAETPGEPQAGTVSVGNLFKILNFQMNKVPELKRYWKKGNIREVLTMEAGETKEVVMKFSKLKWDQHKFKNQSDSGILTDYFHKGLSRFIVLKTRGFVGVNEGNINPAFAGKSAFQPTQLNIILRKTLTGCRQNLLGWSKQYAPNIFGFTEPYAGNAAQPADAPTTVMDKINLYAETIQQTF